MTIESFEGIIISETNYSESSKILNVLTDKYGLIGIMSIISPLLLKVPRLKSISFL